MESWVHLFLLLIPHLEPRSLLWFAISYCVNDCNVRVGIMVLGGEGAAGADEHLKPLKFYAKIFAKLHTLQGKMKMRSHTDWVEWSLKHYFKCFHPWPVSHQASVKLGTNCSCAGAGAVWWNLQGDVKSCSRSFFILLGYLWLEQDFCYLGRRSALQGKNQEFIPW